MMWLVAGAYCFVLWLIFAKLRLLKFSLPIAIITGSLGPFLIIAWLFCAQYYHPLSTDVRAFQQFVPIIPQLTQAGRVTRVAVEPNKPLKKGDLLFEIDPVPYQNQVDRLTSAVSQAQQAVDLAKSSVNVADATFKRAEGDLAYATSERDRYKELLEREAVTQAAFQEVATRYTQASTALDQAVSAQQQANLSVQSAQDQLRQAQAQLENAQYNLKQTTVTAPADGFVTNLQLQEGMLVGGPGGQAVMTFVQDRDKDLEGVVVALVQQKNFLLVEPGNYAEVIFDSYPGEVFKGQVLDTIDASGSGQLTASGELPTDFGTTAAKPFAVRIRLQKEDLRMPAGIQGNAAIYTNHVQIAGIPVMFVIRAESWLNYVF